MGKGTIISGGDMGQYQVQINYSRTRYENMVSELQDKKTVLEETVNGADGLQSKYDDKNQAVQDVQAELNLLIAEFEDEYGTYEAYQSEEKTLRTQLEGLEADLEDLESTLTQYEDQLEALQEDLSVLQSELADLEAEDPPDEDAIALKEAEIADKEQAILNHQALIDGQNDLITAKNEEIAVKEGEISDKKDDITYQKSVLDWKLDQITEKEREGNKVSFELGELKQRLDTAKLEIAAIEKRISYLQDTMPEDETVSAWCADFTEDLTGEVGTIEVPGEKVIVQIQPGYLEDDEVAQMEQAIADSEAFIASVQKAVEEEIVDEEPEKPPEEKEPEEPPEKAEPTPRPERPEEKQPEGDDGRWGEDFTLQTNIQIDPEPIDESEEDPLTGGSSVAGHIGGTGMANLEGIKVTVYRKEGTGDNVSWSYVTSTNTDVGGNYTLAGLSAGTYALKFDDPDGIYLTEYYADKATLDNATEIVVGSDVDITGKNASLGSASTISGIVTD